VTRVALLADLHGARHVLESVVAEAGELGVDEVVVAGDYLECRIGKRRAPHFTATELAEVVALDPPLWRRLADCTLVRGNQEERIDALTAALPRPPELTALLRAPDRRRVADLAVVHGHTFDWTRWTDRWVPTLDDDLPPDRLLVFGHSHQALVTTLVPDADGRLTHRPRTVAAGTVVRLDGEHRHLVNLAPACADDPLWALYDDSDATVAFRAVRVPAEEELACDPER
jgi:predicted phosphodiesterase